MTPTVYWKGTGTAPLWAKAFANGCPGAEVQEGGPLRDGPVAMFGHPQLEPMLDQARQANRRWYYGDHGYFGRGRFYRCTVNALQHDGLQGNDDPKRFRSFRVPVRDWRKSGGHILLCPNSPSFLERHGHANWVEATTRELRSHSDRNIRVRWKDSRTPLVADLRDCWSVVTFTSNAAVEAVLAGIPVFATVHCAASAMGLSDLSKIETPAMPADREAWAARLANNQWALAEMARGDLWRAIGR